MVVSKTTFYLSFVLNSYSNRWVPPALSQQHSKRSTTPILFKWDFKEECLVLSLDINLIILPDELFKARQAARVLISLEFFFFLFVSGTWRKFIMIFSTCVSVCLDFVTYGYLSGELLKARRANVLLILLGNFQLFFSYSCLKRGKKLFSSMIFSICVSVCLSIWISIPTITKEHKIVESFVLMPKCISKTTNELYFRLFCFSTLEWKIQKLKKKIKSL